MIDFSAAQKLSGKNMRTVYCHQCTQISCIRKILKRKPASFWKTNRKIRIQYFKKLKAILYLLLCHIKFITLLTSGYDHQIINDQLLFTGFIGSLTAHVRPENIFTRKTVEHHMSGKHKKAIFDPYFSVSHFLSFLLLNPCAAFFATLFIIPEISSSVYLV